MLISWLFLWFKCIKLSGFRTTEWEPTWDEIRGRNGGIQVNYKSLSLDRLLVKYNDNAAFYTITRIAE